MRVEFDLFNGRDKGRGGMRVASSSDGSIIWLVLLAKEEYEMDQAELEVLRMVEQGKLTADEGARLLGAMVGEDRGPAQPAPRPEPLKDESPPAGPPVAWQRLWIYPFVAGITLLASMGYLTDLLLDGGEKLGWLMCTIPLMILGGLVGLLAWWSSRSRWLHVRVRDANTNLRISLPLPLRPAAWLVRFARPWVPQLKDTALDELLLSLDEVKTDEGILVVDVNEGDQERVQVYYG